MEPIYSNRYSNRYKTLCAYVVDTYRRRVSQKAEYFTKPTHAVQSKSMHVATVSKGAV